MTTLDHQLAAAQGKIETLEQKRGDAQHWLNVETKKVTELQVFLAEAQGQLQRAREALKRAKDILQEPHPMASLEVFNDCIATAIEVLEQPLSSPSLSPTPTSAVSLEELIELREFIAKTLKNKNHGIS